jgi:hypothetical protein
MRRTLLIYEQTVEREGEEVWALWEEVGSRGPDTWTGLPAVYAIPNGSDSQPGGSIPRALGKRRQEGARAAVPVLSVSARSRFVLEEEGR